MFTSLTSKHDLRELPTRLQTIDQARCTGPVALVGCALTEIELTGCQLTSVTLEGCRLQATNLDGCDMRGADLRGLDLSEIRSAAVLRGAVIEHAQLPGPTTALVRELELIVTWTRWGEPFRAARPMVVRNAAACPAKSPECCDAVEQERTAGRQQSGARYGSLVEAFTHGGTVQLGRDGDRDLQVNEVPQPPPETGNTVACG